MEGGGGLVKTISTALEDRQDHVGPTVITRPPSNAARSHLRCNKSRPAQTRTLMCWGLQPARVQVASSQRVLAVVTVLF